MGVSWVLITRTPTWWMNVFHELLKFVPKKKKKLLISLCIKEQRRAFAYSIQQFSMLQTLEILSIPSWGTEALYPAIFPGGFRTWRRHHFKVDATPSTSHQHGYVLYTTVKFRYQDHLKLRLILLKKAYLKSVSLSMCVFCTQCLLERDHLWDCSKVALKTTFEQPQRWSYYRNFTVLVSMACVCGLRINRFMTMGQ